MDKAPVLKRYELTTEYQPSIEPLLYKLVEENLLVGYDFRYSPSNKGCYKNEREDSAAVILVGVSKKTAERVAQAICELKEGHKKKEQESVVISVSDGEVYFYENKNLRRSLGLREALGKITSFILSIFKRWEIKVDSPQIHRHNL